MRETRLESGSRILIRAQWVLKNLGHHATDKFINCYGGSAIVEACEEPKFLRISNTFNISLIGELF